VDGLYHLLKLDWRCIIRAQNNSRSSVIFQAKSHNGQPNQKWSDIIAYQDEPLKYNVHPNYQVLDINDQPG